MADNIHFIPIVHLQPHPDNTRLFHDIEGEQWEFFKSDLARNGILQPLLVIADGESAYTVLSGHQRLRAAKALGMEDVPCIVMENTTSRKDILISANLGRQLSIMERYRITMHLLDKMEDGRKDRAHAETGKFSKGKKAGNPAKTALDEDSTIPSQNDGMVGSLRDRVAEMVPGVNRNDIAVFRKIKDLPAPVQGELFAFVEKENPNKRQLKEKVNALNAEKRRLKAELREEKKIKQTKRELERMRDYLAAEVDPRENYEARVFDETNQALNRACAEISGFVQAVFSHGPIPDKTARILEPGVMALADILKNERSRLLERWRSRNRSLAADAMEREEE